MNPAKNSVQWSDRMNLVKYHVATVMVADLAAYLEMCEREYPPISQASYVYIDSSKVLVIWRHVEKVTA